MSAKFLLGVAAGVGITYFLTSSKGQAWLESVGQRFSDGLNRGEDLLLDATEGLETVRQKVVETTRKSALA